MTLPISNPKADLHYIYAHTKFRNNPLIVTEVIVPKQKQECEKGRCLSKTDKFAH